MPNAQESLDAGFVLMKLVLRSVPDTIIITQYMLLNSVFCSPHFYMYLSLQFSQVRSPQSAFYTDDFQFDFQ